MKWDAVDVAPWIALGVTILLLVAMKWRRLRSPDSAVSREFGFEVSDNAEEWELSSFEDERLVPESQ